MNAVLLFGIGSLVGIGIALASFLSSPPSRQRCRHVSRTVETMSRCDECGALLPISEAVRDAFRKGE